MGSSGINARVHGVDFAFILQDHGVKRLSFPDFTPAARATTSTVKMTAFWRAAGLNYIQYSNVAAKVVRRCLKPDLKVDAGKREVVSIKFTKWEDGKAVGSKKK